MISAKEIQEQFGKPTQVDCWTCGNVDSNPQFLENWTAAQFAKPPIKLPHMTHVLWICPHPGCTGKFDRFLLGGN